MKTLFLVMALTLGSTGCAIVRAMDPYREPGHDISEDYLADVHSDSPQADPFSDRIDSMRYTQASAYNTRDDEDPQLQRQERIQRHVRNRDLVLGMSIHDVRDAWGEPRDVEIAGSSASGNQRWIYNMGLFTATSAARIVYFEQGRVVGWETVRP